METRFFSEYEDVLILVNFVRYGGDFNAIFECFERRKSRNSIKRRYEDYIRYYPYKVGNWTPYEDYILGLWGNLEPYMDPWDKLAFTFRRRAPEIKHRYRKLQMTTGRLYHGPMSLRSFQIYQRGKRVLDISYYILQNGIEPRMQTIREFVNILKLYDDDIVERANACHGAN